MAKEGVTMSMPWFKTPTTDDNFQLHAIGAENRGYYWDLLRMKGRGALDQPLDYVHIPHFHSLLTAWVAKCIGLSKRKAQQLKETLLLLGLINEYWQPVDWEQLHGPRAYRQNEAVADDSEKEVKEKPRAKTSTERSRKHRDKQKACNDDATPCNDDATVATLHATQVQRNRVASPVAPSENLLENQCITTCNENALDVRALDLDSKSLKAKATHARTDDPNPDSHPAPPAQATAKAKATRETTAQAPPSTPGEDVTDVTKAKAIATATATADDLPLADLPAAGSDLSSSTEPSRDKESVPADPAVAFDSSTVPAARPEPSETPFRAPSTHENDPDKEIIHNPTKHIENEEKPMTSKKPAPVKPLKSAPISLKHYLQIRHERGLPVIDDDHPIDQWAKERHFPSAFLGLAWEVFAEKYSKGFGKRYAYEYWQERFSDSVKTNQYGLWRIDAQSKAYRLSQKGLQAFVDIDIKKTKEESKTEIKQPAPPMASQTTKNKPDDDDEGDGGAWFLSEFKKHCGYPLSEIFSSQQLISNANAH